MSVTSANTNVLVGSPMHSCTAVYCRVLPCTAFATRFNLQVLVEPRTW